jgi:ABC-2 type transport system ATP-binding protein
VRADRTGDKWQITGDDRDSLIRSLVAFSQQQGAVIVTLNTLAPSLDDAFLRLTQGASP